MEHLPANRVVQLRGEQLAQHVVVIIGRRHDHVDLAGVVGLVAPFRPAQLLIPLDQVPPEPVQVLVRIGVSAFSKRNITWHQREKIKS